MSDHDLYDLPPSAKYVHTVLVYEAPLTYSEIVEETDLPESTVTDALDSLREHGLVDERIGGDARSRCYVVAE